MLYLVDMLVREKKGVRSSVASISDQDIQKVREANDIVAVFNERTPVRQRGRDFWCCCPIHEEKSPSCKLDPASQLWHCFGCGAGGDVFSFIMKADDLSFPDAVRKLADRASIHITESDDRSGAAQGYKTRLKEVCKETAQFYHTQLMRSKDTSAATARTYLAGRGFGGEVPKRWMLGFAGGNGILIKHLTSKGFKAKELVDANVATQTSGRLRERFYNRIMFPITDSQGEVIAFGGRIIGEGQPKYLNSQETPIFHKSQVLYGLDKGKAAMATTGTAVVVEGYTDVIALHEAGIGNAVATLGTALTPQHIRTLARHAKRRIIYLFDGDEAGQRAADRALAFIDESITPEAGRSKIELLAITLPDDLDPADYVAKYGSESLQALFDSAETLISYGISRRLAKYDLSNAEGRSRAFNDALSILAPIKDSLLAKDYAVQIAGMTRFREEDAYQRLSQLKIDRNISDQSVSAQEQQVQSAQSTSSKETLSQAERNRRKAEREFLSVCARYPQLALLHANALAQTQWHEPVHATLSENILSTLEENAQASAAEIVSAAQSAINSASNILTSGVMTEKTDPAELAAFLTEELGIGDLEDGIEAINSQLKNPQGLSGEEQEFLFESVTAMQKDLRKRRAAHKPLAPTSL